MKEDIFKMYCQLVVTLLLITTSSTLRHPDGLTYKECVPTAKTCEFWLIIQEKLTMIFHKDLVYADKGKLYLYNEHPSNFTTQVIHASLKNYDL